MNLGYQTAFRGLTNAFSGAANGVDPSLHNREQTLLQKITPNVTRHVPAFNAAEHMAGGPNVDFQTLNGQVAGVKDQAQQLQNGITSDIRQAQAVLMESVAEVAKMQDIPVANAIRAVFPDQSSTQLNAIATVAMDLSMMGGGTAVTFAMQGVSSMNDIISQAKTGGIDKQKLLDQALDQMRASQSADPMSQAAQTAKGVVPDNKFDWSNVGVQDLELLASVDAEKPGAVIPEWDAAQKVVIETDKVHQHNQEIEHHLDQQDHYEFEISGVSGDSLMTDFLDFDVAGEVMPPVDALEMDEDAVAAVANASLTAEPDTEMTLVKTPVAAMRNSSTVSY